MKKMKNFILLLIMFLALEVTSQEKNIMVEYDIYYNTSSPRVKKAYLSFFNNNKSNFIELPEFKLLKDIEDNKNDDNDLRINVNYFPKGILKEVSIDYNSKKLSSIETIVFDNNAYKVNEKIPNFTWNTNYNQNKKIGKYLCSKATTNFRGRKYIVWYTEEIPLRFGPWKLTGLPGLILEAYDETLKYRWIVKKIGGVDKKFLLIRKKVKYHKSIELEEFVRIKYGDNTKAKNFEKKIKSKLPRGAKVKVKRNKFRQNKELIYEWEEEIKEK